MSIDQLTLARCQRIAAVYLLVLMLAFLWWATISGHWAGGFVPLYFRLLVGVWQATGPFAFLLRETQSIVAAPLLVFAIVWLCWLTIVFISPLRHLPLPLHFCLAVGWFAIGFVPTSILVT